MFAAWDDFIESNAGLEKIDIIAATMHGLLILEQA